jgi:hypothetical protein
MEPFGNNCIFSISTLEKNAFNLGLLPEDKKFFTLGSPVPIKTSQS